MSEGGEMTWGELVKRYFPDAGEAEIEYILWEKTAFPFADDEKTYRRQIYNFRRAVSRQLAVKEASHEPAQ